MRSNIRKDRRGLAMLLVLISLMMATILTMAYVSSRDNSAVIGENVASSAAARWAAESGLEMGVAVLETKTDWRTASAAGKLLDDYPLSGGTVDIDVLDIATGTPPTAKTENVKLTATAVVDGVQQVASAMAYVPVTTDTGVDVDLSEFAVFASNAVALSEDAIVTRWPKAPLSVLGRPISVGVQSTAASTVTISNNGAAIDTQVFSGPGVSSSLVAIGNSTKVSKTAVLDTIPMPAPPDSGISTPTVLPILSPLNQSGGSVIINASKRYSTATISNTAKYELRGAVNMVTNSNLTMTNNAKIIVNGAVKIATFGDLDMQSASIELSPGATLTMYVAGTMTMRDSYIGDVRSNTVRDNTGAASVIEPDRIKLYRMPGYTTATDWIMRDNTVMKASVYAPAVRFLVRDTSALYGRVAASEVRVKDASAIFYNPAMDSRTGYTQSGSAVYLADGHIKPEIRTLTSLSASTLQTTANLLGIRVKGADSTATMTPVAMAADTPVVVGPTDPTPRPVIVEHDLLTFGSDMSTWEQH